MANLTGAEINKINLAPFCSADETRAVIMSPFRIGEWTYATDGRVLLRVPASDYPAEEKEKAPKVNKTDFGLCWNHDELSNEFWQPLPPVEILTEEVRCEQCGGTGLDECPHCYHESDCLECHSKGMITRQTPNDVMVGQFRFASHYILKIRELTNIQIWLNPSADCHKVASLRFDGGCGYLMPMRCKL